MKCLVLSVMLAVAVDADHIVTEDDHFDFGQLNHDQLTAVAKCFMSQGPCDDVILSYKKHYPDVMINACNRCNSAQKAIARRFFKRVEDELPEINVQLRKTLDPEGKYFDRFLAALN